MWPNPQGTANLVTFAEKLSMENFFFVCSVDDSAEPVTHSYLFDINFNSGRVFLNKIKWVARCDMNW